MAYFLDGAVSGPTGFLNGAQVDAWLASRFVSTPGAGDKPPAGLPDAGPVLSGTNFGGPGQWVLEVPSASAYYVRVTYPVGATNAKSYWAYDDTLVQVRGPQGYQGVQGAQGFQGNQGLTGPQGVTGAQGPTGSQGSQGFQGATGPQGTQGTQGVQGYQGNQGYQGTQGFQGPQGYQGLTGAASTVQGPQGYQGPQGVQGTQGNTGVPGPQGAIGVQGYQGTQGVQGATGYQGIQGAQGNQGFQGYQGTQGATGSVGTQGPQGDAGAQGSQGPQGATGSTGPQGNQGSTGPQGAQGPQGYQGNQGYQGTQGPQGFGMTGPQGPQGFQGYQGQTGITGPQGFQGFQGTPGPQGSQGAGVPTGGTAGQALIKLSSTDYNTGWQAQLPLIGGTMSGAIAMGTNRITGLAAPGAVGDALRAGDFSTAIGPRFHTNSLAVPVLAWTVEPMNAGAASGPVSNRTYWQAIYIPYAMTVNGVVFSVSSVGTSITSSSIGLYDSSGNRLVQQSNANAGFGTASTGTIAVAFSSSYPIATPGVYWIGFHVQATTPPTLIRGQSANAAAVNININATAGTLNFRSGYSGTGAIPASFPAGTPTLDVAPWLFGLY